MNLNNLKIIQNDENSFRNILPESKISSPHKLDLSTATSISNPVTRNTHDNPLEIGPENFNKLLTLDSFPSDNFAWFRINTDNIKKISLLGLFANPANFKTIIYKLDLAASTINPIASSENIFSDSDTISFLPEGGYYYMSFEWISGDRTFGLYIETSNFASAHEPNDAFSQATPYTGGVVKHRDTFDGVFDREWIKVTIPTKGDYRASLTFEDATISMPISMYIMKLDVNSSVTLIGSLQNQTAPFSDVSISPTRSIQPGIYYICLLNGATPDQFNKEYNFTLEKPVDKPAKYYFNRYNVGKQTTYTKDSEWKFLTDSMVFYKNKNALASYESNVSFDSSTGMYTITYNNSLHDWGYLGDKDPDYLTNSIVNKPGDTLYRCQTAACETSFTGTKVYTKKATSTTRNVCGTLVQQNIINDENAYPSNGIASDGYWYIRGNALPVAPPVNPTVNPPVTPPVDPPNEKYQYDKYTLAKGGYISSIEGTINQYPVDGHQDGFWYVRIRKV